VRFNYVIEGMHCEACIEKIKMALSSHVNVIEVTLNPPLLKVEARRAPGLKKLNADLSLIGKYRLQPVIHNTGSGLAEEAEGNKNGLRSYYPIFLITAYIVTIAFINNFHGHSMNWQGWMSQFMAGFFLVFSAFKFLDIRGFAEGYATYDLLARRWHTYGFIYPFLELILGLLYLTGWFFTTTQLLTIFIMGFSSLGVINSLLKKQKIQCACLGTILKVPLSTVTLTEDLTMVALAVLALVMR